MPKKKETGPAGPEEQKDSLDALIRCLEEIDAQVSILSQKVPEQLKQREEALKKLKLIYEGYEKARTKLESYDPYKGLTFSDYSRLVKEKIIDELTAQKLTTLWNRINKLEAQEDILDETQKEILNYAKEELAKHINTIQSQIEKARGRWEEKRKNALERLDRQLKEKTVNLEELIKSIEANPAVISALYEMAKQEELERQKTIKEFVEDAYASFQSIRDRHQNAFKRIAELTNQDPAELIKNLKNYYQAKSYSHFNPLRNELIKAILAKKLKSLNEVIPWYMPSKHHHGTSLEFLEGIFEQEQLKKISQEQNLSTDTRSKVDILLKSIPDIIVEANIFRILFPQFFLKIYQIFNSGGIIAQKENKYYAISLDFVVDEKQVKIKITDASARGLPVGKTFGVKEIGGRLDAEIPKNLLWLTNEINNWLKKNQNKYKELKEKIQKQKGPEI